MLPDVTVLRLYALWLRELARCAGLWARVLTATADATQAWAGAGEAPPNWPAQPAAPDPHGPVVSIDEARRLRLAAAPRAVSGATTSLDA